MSDTHFLEKILCRSHLFLLTCLLPAVVSAQEFTDTSINESFHIITADFPSGPAAIGMFTGQDGTLLVDTMIPRLAQGLYEEIGRLAEHPVAYIINTHKHSDHTGANNLFRRDGARVIRARQVYERFTDPAEPVADILFDGEMTLHFNGENIRLFRLTSHSHGDAVVYFENNNVIFMGDIYLSRWLPQDIDLDRQIAAYDFVLGLSNENTVIVPGHGGISNRSGLRAYRDNLVGLRDIILGLDAKGVASDEMFADPGLLDLVNTISVRYDSSLPPDQFPVTLLRGLITSVLLRQDYGPPPELSGDQLQALSGQYRFSEDETATTLVTVGHVLLVAEDRYVLDLIPVSETEFYAPGNGTRFIFNREDGGRVVSLTRVSEERSDTAMKLN